MNLTGAKLAGDRKAISKERRGGRRFPIEQAVHYRVRAGSELKVGSGWTIDISSGGVLFTTQHNLELGDVVEVSVDWPALLDGHCHLKLVIVGNVVRTSAGVAAITRQRHEFRTQGANGSRRLRKTA